jgi:hypothetical protein
MTNDHPDLHILHSSTNTISIKKHKANFVDPISAEDMINLSVDQPDQNTINAKLKYQIDAFQENKGKGILNILFGDKCEHMGGPEKQS